MAGNIRFHNKFHAYTHYTDPVPGIPDSAMDPIASKDAPFLGNMFVAGCLSARGWLDEDGTCRKFLFEPEPIVCRPIVVCGDHMEGALHYSHTDYTVLSGFDPLRLDLDFKKHTFKTIHCDTNEYHIMPVSLSAGCVTSTRFVNPSANGHVDIAFHPDLRWLNPRPCILSAGESAILSMTCFSEMLSDVMCVWKEEEYVHEEPFLQYSPTIVLNNEYLYYKVDTCAPVVYKFVLDDIVDVARIDLNGHPILVCQDKGDLIWDDVSMLSLTSGPFSAQQIPDVFAMHNTFPTRAIGRNITDIAQVKELIDKTQRITFSNTISKDYNDCQYDITFTGYGSLLFNVAAAGATVVDKPKRDATALNKITVGQSKFITANGDYFHDFNYYDNGYVGDPGTKRTVLNDRIWTKLVRPHDPAYSPGVDRYYTIERHMEGVKAWWLMKDPFGDVLYRNYHSNYGNNQNYPLQNGWEPGNPKTMGTVPRLFIEGETAYTYDGLSYSRGSADYITDAYVPLKNSGDFYGLCFNGWSTYYVPSDNNISAYLADELSPSTGTSNFEPIYAFIIPGGQQVVDGPTLAIVSPTQSAVRPWDGKYNPGDPVRVFTLPGEEKLPDVYNNDVTDPNIQSTVRTDGYFANGGTYRIAKKRMATLQDNGQTVLTLRLSCF